MADTDASGPSKGYIIFNVNVAMLVITTLIVAIRFYVRGVMVKALGLDDALAAVSYGLAVALSCLEIQNVHNGAGQQMRTLSGPQLNAFFSLLPVAQLIYFLGAGFVRLSILAFLPRLSRDRIYMRCVWVVGFFITAITLASFFFLLTECKPILDLFNAGNPNRKCLDKSKEAYMMWTHAIVGICADIALFALPVWVIRSKMKSGAQAFKVMLVFCVGLFVIITGVVRFGMIVTTNFAINTTYKMVKVAPWTDLEVHVGLWCGSFPALQPLLRLVSYQLGFRSRLESTNKKTTHPETYPTSRSRDWPGASGYHKHSSAHDHQRDVVVTGGDSTTDIVAMGDIDSHSGIRMRTDVEVQIEEGVIPRDRHDMKTTWDAV
ncbi:hypothetical protein G7046_g9570 [Stylonectria norvegica]|nr:hypothetical protein G7046_g9570 [Stylonectria norvegica]